MTYMEMSAPEMLAACRDDASKWAAAFCETARSKGLDIDEDWMIGWFANAIEHSYDVPHWRRRCCSSRWFGGLAVRMTSSHRIALSDPRACRTCHFCRRPMPCAARDKAYCSPLCKRTDLSPGWAWASLTANRGKPKIVVLPLLTFADLGRLLSPGKLDERESP